MEGYVRLHREIINNPIFKKPLINHLFVYCLLRANHKDHKTVFNCQEVEVERGSFICGRKKFAEATGETEQNVRSALRTLQNLGMVQISTSKSTSKYSYITVCNYNDYQYNGDEGNQQTNHEATSKQPANNQQVTTDNNVNNVLNDSNEENIKEIQKKSFEEWWINWKTKARENPGVKNKAEKHWKVLNKKLSAEQIQKATDLHFKASGKFHKAAERFLNPADGLVMQLLEEPPPQAVPQQQPRIPAVQTISPGNIQTFKIEIANMNPEAAKNLWEMKPKLFREHPKLQQIYHNKLKEETHDPEILQQQGSI